MADTNSIQTIAVQAGRIRAGHADPSVPPIVPSVGFTHPTLADTDRALGYSGSTPADADQYVYGRHGGPNAAALEEAIAEMEGAEGAVSFASGMAALHAGLLAYVPAGGKIVAAEQLYGVTRTLLDWMAANMGVEVRLVDFLDVERAQAAIREGRPQAVLAEVLTNPLSRVMEIDKIAEAAREVHAPLIVDNTFATPYLLRPLAVGADLVVHSTTKFLNGHGDVTGGVIAGEADAMQIAFQMRRLLGAVPSAFDAWLTLRGLRTFAVRMRQHCENAMQVAAWLDEHPRVERVYYPGLAGDGGHAAATRLFEGKRYGSMIAFEIADVDREETFAYVGALQLIRPVTSLGDVFSLVLHPASTSHRALTPEQRAAQGIREGVLRLSVGIEDAGDLIADLAGAFDTLG